MNPSSILFSINCSIWLSVNGRVSWIAPDMEAIGASGMMTNNARIGNILGIPEGSWRAPEDLSLRVQDCSQLIDLALKLTRFFMFWIESESFAALGERRLILALLGQRMRFLKMFIRQSPVVLPITKAGVFCRRRSGGGRIRRRILRRRDCR
jgi:hypothetical protein